VSSQLQGKIEMKVGRDGGKKNCQWFITRPISKVKDLWVDFFWRWLGGYGEEQPYFMGESVNK